MPVRRWQTTVVLGVMGLLLSTAPGRCGWDLASPGYTITGTLTLTSPGSTTGYNFTGSTAYITAFPCYALGFSLTGNFGATLVYAKSPGSTHWREPFIRTTGTATWSYLWAGSNPSTADAWGSCQLSTGGVYTALGPDYTGSPAQLMDKGGRLTGGRLYTRINPDDMTVSGSGLVTCGKTEDATGSLGGTLLWSVCGVGGPKRYSRLSVWQISGAPYYPVQPQPNYQAGGGMSGGDPINLKTGQHAYLPAPDIVVYNPTGPAAVYQRNWWSERTMDDGYFSSGLTEGWVDNYDVSIRVEDGACTLVYPNGAEDSISPTTHAGPAGAPYRVTGVASGTSDWSSITLTFNDGTTWQFARQAGSDDLLLSAIGNKVGRYISVVRETGPARYIGDDNAVRVKEIDDDQGAALLTFTYSGSYLSKIKDRYGRHVSYSGSLLSTVSHINAPNAEEAAHWTYTYYHVLVSSPDSESLPSAMIFPHIQTVKYAAPGGGTTTQTFNYETHTEYRTVASGLPEEDMCAKVTSIEDGNGNVTSFSYDATDSTLVTVRNASGDIVQQTRVYFDSDGRCTGSLDAQNHRTTIAYNGAAGPSSVTNANGNTTAFTYDQYGKLTSVTEPNNLVTTLTYDYTNFALGRLTSIAQGSKSPVLFTYLEPSGLPASVSYPLPGSVGGDTYGTMSYTYDTLGNILTKTAPGPNGTNITTTFNYTTDGAYTQSAKVNQPIAISDGQGHVAHLRYDARGNVTSMTDPLGRTADMIYNPSDQVTFLRLPATP